MRFRPDPSLRRLDDVGRVVLGGSPLRLWRLTERGAAVAGRLLDGVDVDVSDPGAGRLADRFVDAGALHPDPASIAPVLEPADVTVVVPVRDRTAPLERLLRSLAPLASTGAAVVVVDDGSVDGAAHERIAVAAGARYLRRETSGGPAAARDDGAAVATTPVLAFVDSDCVVAPTAGWITPLLTLLGDGRWAVAVAPRVRAVGGGVLGRYESLRSPLDLGLDPAQVAPGSRVSYVPAAVLVVRTDAYRAAGGFDRSMRVGEDVDLVWRLVAAGERVRYEPTVRVEHPTRPGFRAWIRQRVDYGSSAAALDHRHPHMVAPVRCSPWSAAGWALGAAVHPALGAVVLGTTAAVFPRKLDGVSTVEALRLVGAGHLGAGAQLGRAVVRVWWPASVAAALGSRRARRVVAASVGYVAVSAAVRARRADPSIGRADAVAVGALAVVDDVAYGAGVWLGCVRSRSFRAVLPSFPRSAHRFDRAQAAAPDLSMG